MLMQEAEVRSSAGQHVRSHSSKNVAVFLKCVKVRSTAEEHCVFVKGPCSHADARCSHAGSHAEARCSHAALCSHADARTTWNRRQCVRPQVLRSTALSMPDMSRTETES
jgi:hypothetical protein